MPQLLLAVTQTCPELEFKKSIVTFGPLPLITAPDGAVHEYVTFGLGFVTLNAAAPPFAQTVAGPVITGVAGGPVMVTLVHPG